MPALSPTMEEGTLARWLIKPGDKVQAGDIMAEIETDKATMEFEAVDEGTLASIAVEEGSEGVKVGTVIAMLAEEGEDVDEAAKAAPAGDAGDAREEKVEQEAKRTEEPKAEAQSPAPSPAPQPTGDRIVASPLAKRIAEQKGLDLSQDKGSGPNGRIVKADVEKAQPGKASATADKAMTDPKTPAKTPAESDFGAPYEAQKLNNVRKVIARRLTEAKQTIPHIYLTVDVRLDALLKLRSQLNASLEADGVKLSVNDLLIKALARALQRVPACNVSFQGDELHQYTRQDISVAVAAPSGLITPIVVDAGRKGLAQIGTEM
jgi:pyruvate dehydrogenase E2 component (dihydrolipoamide acetyltransferase)